MNYLLVLDEKFHDTIANIYSSLMPKERRAFFSQCKNALRKRQTVGAYLLLSYALGQEYSIEDIRLTIRYNKQGKPYLQKYPHIFFNLSHSGKYVLCSLGNEGEHIK